MDPQVTEKITQGADQMKTATIKVDEMKILGFTQRFDRLWYRLH